MAPPTCHTTFPRADWPNLRDIGFLMQGRAAGALVGLAIGDALGTTLEFSARDIRPHHTEMTGGGPFDLPPGVWTDDTAMAMALADSILACRGLDPTDLMQRFCSWWRDGRYSPTGTCFDIGVTTREALARFERTGDPLAGSRDPRAAGNGGIMRLAPVVIAGSGIVSEDFAIVQSMTTHAAPEAVDAARLMAKILSQLIFRDDGFVEPVTINHLLVPDFRGAPAIEAIARGEWRTKTRDEIHSSGYVVHTLEAALWAVGQTQSFEEALILAVNLADDADTVGAVTGQIAGALYRSVDIPDRWWDRLAEVDHIMRTANSLFFLNTIEADEHGCFVELDPVRLRGAAADIDLANVKMRGCES